jgi:hypothetical protein
MFGCCHTLKLPNFIIHIVHLLLTEFLANFYHTLLFWNRAAEASASKRYIIHMTCFILFIQQRPARGLTMIIQAEATKKVSKHRHTSTNARGLDTLCLGYRHRRLLGIIQRNALCTKPRGHIHLFLPTHLWSGKLKWRLTPDLPSTPPRHQTMPLPCPSSSGHDCRRDPTAPNRQETMLSMC